MKKKSILLILGIGVIALCLASAGCVGNSSNPFGNLFDPIVGNWLGGGAELQLESDGTGVFTVSMLGTYKYPVSWKKTGDKTYEIEGMATSYTRHYTLSSDGKQLTSKDRSSGMDYVISPFVKQ